MLKQKSLRERIGVVPQTTTLFNDTLGTNIAYGKVGASEAEIQEALQAAQLSNFVESLPGESLIACFHAHFIIFLFSFHLFHRGLGDNGWRSRIEIVWRGETTHGYSQVSTKKVRTIARLLTIWVSCSALIHNFHQKLLLLPSPPICMFDEATSTYHYYTGLTRMFPIFFT